MSNVATHGKADLAQPEACRSDTLDTLANAWRARSTGGLSPAAGLLAWYDWALHLSLSPGKQRSLIEKGLHKQQRLARYALRVASAHDCPTCIEPLEQDRRFAAPAWQQWPFNVIHQGFLLQQQWWHNATTGVRGVSRHHENMVTFAGRQWLDMWSPSNFIWTNPEVLHAITQSGGANLWRGAMNFLDDVRRLALDDAPAGVEGFEVGKDVAITPGKVVFRNHLIELIQYSPTTPDVHAEPVLIVPSWIMKYYILDLSPHDSLVKYLVDQGHTVFCISWKNPGEAEHDLGMDDYLRDGFHAALDAVNAILPKRKVHAAGYCLGGTLLAIAAAAMARDGDTRLASTSYFAAQTDFSEPGELGLFIDASQVSLLEAQMAKTGYLKASQMAGAFQMLRSYDLLWSRLVHDYLLGDRSGFNDLMAWNADTTRMPATMHSQYLRRLFLNDDLSEGRYPVDGRPVSLGSLTLPTFMVGTATDHVAPWRSVHKLHYLCPAEITFVLTSGGHNAGIVNPPVSTSKRQYQWLTREAGGTYLAPDEWLAAASTVRGSWWPAWQQWLAARSGAQVKPPRMGSSAYPATADAPGSYVLEK